MQLVNALYFITAATAVAVPATMGSKASTTPVDYDLVMPTYYPILLTNTY